MVSTSGYALYGLAVSETQLFAVAADTGAVKIWNKATRAGNLFFVFIFEIKRASSTPIPPKCSEGADIV